ncbi:MAG: acyltransferase [Micavibrio aeruginosavorus]|uniref:Acyltransferase n=1 Tax=Micavibrio aeruginosavorus TaxID=349221 RepID=A0A2W5A0U6_9BACT|nr:MAG: acyltransferase [Micavibrio aeruginosavorus]
MSNLKYRPDIDGLRAIAITLVLLYHADLWNVNGGYIGVDVFFVISGFLITSLILKDLQYGTFSFFDFWERRIRRILPALGVVTLFTLVAGWFIFLPEDYATLGKQAASQTVFSSNILFYTMSGYFAAENSTKPLLHTWSLAVEEQYYFIIPLLLVILFAKLRLRMQTVLLAIMIVSFAASVWAVKYYPDAAFYLLPFRSWEMLVGSLLAFHGNRESRYNRGWRAETLATLGFMAIVAAGMLYTPKTSFPGVAALVPCLGAAMIIYANGMGGKTLVGRFLSSKPLVFIGLISYSLYLWHWPLLMFAEYLPVIELRSLHKLGLLLISGILAYLSWRYVEQPTRRKSLNKTNDRASIYTYAGGGLALIALISIGIVVLKGIPQRWSAQELQYAEGAKDINYSRWKCEKSPEDIKSAKLCTTSQDLKTDPAFILWGDSHADAWVPGFEYLSQKYRVNGYQATLHSCPPLLDLDKKGSTQCEKQNAAVLELIKSHKIKNVFLVANWTGWLDSSQLFFTTDAWYKKSYDKKFDDIKIAALQRTIDTLRAEGANVYILVNNARMPFDPPRTLALQNIFTKRRRFQLTLLKRSGKRQSIF